jgi:hypothetical protein
VGESLFSSGLKPYSKYEIDNLRGSDKVAIARNNEQVCDFIEKSFTGKIRGKKLLLGKIGDDLAQKIYNKTGTDLKSYNLELRADEIRHAYNEHGDEKNETSRGQQAITTDDIANFPRIVYDFDDIKTEWGNSLHFIKNINGRTTAVTVYVAGNKSLSMKTMYKWKESGGSGPTSNASNGP